MIGYVYKTTNDINDTIYIGKRQKPKFEKCYKGSGTHFKLALKKYGKEKFHTVILEECETAEDLCRAEKKWIELYKKSGAKLYNIASGGLGGNMVDWGSLPSEKRDSLTMFLSLWNPDSIIKLGSTSKYFEDIFPILYSFIPL